MIAAEGEQKASRALKEAADVIQESPAALQVNSVENGGRKYSYAFLCIIALTHPI